MGKTNTPWWRCLKPKKKTEMAFYDKLVMSPWDKWNKHNRFPWKPIVHLGISLFSAFLVLLYVTEYAAYTRSTTDTYHLLFVPEGGKILSINDCVAAINNSIITYSQFTNQSVDQYMIPKQEGSYKDPIITMDVTRYAVPFYNRTTGEYIFSNFKNLTVVQEKYKISKNDLGPLNATGTDLQTFFYSLVEIHTTFTFKNLAIGTFGAVPFMWTVIVYYDFTVNGGQVAVDLFISQEVTDIGSFSTLWFFVFMDSVVLLFAITSSILSLRGLISNYALYVKTKRRFRIQAAMPDLNSSQDRKMLKIGVLVNFYKSWGSVPLSIKIQFLNLWHFWSLLGSIFLISASVLGILNAYGHVPAIIFELFLGTGTFMTVINMIRYLEYSERFNTLIITLKVSFFRVLFFVITVAPLFLSFALFGVLMFSQYSDEFSTFDRTCVTLFALLNGDSILTIFDDLAAKYPYPLLTRVYLFVFVVLFITAILNTFIFIIEDAYHSAKRWGFNGKKQEEPPSINIKKLFQVVDYKHSSMKNPKRDSSMQMMNSGGVSINGGSNRSYLSYNSEFDPFEEEEEDLLELIDEDGEYAKAKRQQRQEALRALELERHCNELRSEIDVTFSQNQQRFVTEIQTMLDKLSTMQTEFETRLKKRLPTSSSSSSLASPSSTSSTSSSSSSSSSKAPPGLSSLRQTKSTMNLARGSSSSLASSLDTVTRTRAKDGSKKSERPSSSSLANSEPAPKSSTPSPVSAPSSPPSSPPSPTPPFSAVSASSSPPSDSP